MPTINRESINLEGVQFMREIKVDSTGEFSIALPKLLSDAGIGEKVKATTRDGAIRAFDAALKQFRDSNTECKRIIGYRLKTSCYIWRNGCVVFKDDGVSFSQGTTLSLCAQVFDEFTTRSPDGKLSFRYSQIDSAIPRGLGFQWTGGNGQIKGQIPHTPEAEAFFAKMGNSMEEMILTLVNGFQRPEAVLALIQAGPLALT